MYVRLIPPEEMPSNNLGRNLRRLQQGRVRPMQLVLRRQALRVLRAKAQVAFA